MKSDKPFWEAKTLAEMSKTEWEALCDGCGRCCIYILHNEETGDVFETDVACRLFDAKKRRCRDYANRSKHVPDCVRLTPENAGDLHWMPDSCAYRLLAAGEKLPQWHPLLTGDRESVVRAGIAISSNLKNENDVEGEKLENHITRER